MCFPRCAELDLAPGSSCIENGSQLFPGAAQLKIESPLVKPRLVLLCCYWKKLVVTSRVEFFLLNSFQFSETQGLCSRGRVGFQCEEAQTTQRARCPAAAVLTGFLESLPVGGGCKFCLVL